MFCFFCLPEFWVSNKIHHFALCVYFTLKTRFIICFGRIDFILILVWFWFYWLTNNTDISRSATNITNAQQKLVISSASVFLFEMPFMKITKTVDIWTNGTILEREKLRLIYFLCPFASCFCRLSTFKW